MRSHQTISITLPHAMLARAAALAKREDRTMSELMREALRHYEQVTWWNDVNAYGLAKARARGLTEADVESAVRAVRGRKPKNKPKKKPK